MSHSLKEKLDILRDYSACDVSDALLKLEKPSLGRPARAGYLTDIVPFAPCSPFSSNKDQEQPRVIALVSTMKLIDKSDPQQSLSLDDPCSIPKGSHWADVTEPGTVLVIEQPRHQTCAAVGGIMATRMKIRDLAGCVVSGRVRDLAELRNSGLPIWAAGRSTVGSGAESKVYARNVKVDINDVEIEPGDIIVCDPLEGVVRIPQSLLDQVLELMPKLVTADDKVKEDVNKGSTVQAAFKAHRS